MRLPGDITYAGQYVEGKKHGVGTMHWEAEAPKCWTGQWFEGKKHGRGIYTNSKGIEKEGIWENDNFKEKVQILIPPSMQEPEDELVEMDETALKICNGQWLCNKT